MRVLAYLTIAFVIGSFQGLLAENKLNSQYSYSLAQLNDEEIGSQHFKKIYDSELKRLRLIKDTVIVKFHNTTRTEVIEHYLQNYGLEIVSDLGNNTFLCKLSKVNDNENLVVQLNNIKAIIKEQSLHANSLVENFDLNEYKQIQLSDNNDDSFLNLQWHLINDGINGVKKGADINADKAWEYSHGQGSKVAIIDTGIDMKLKKKVNILGKGINARIIDQSLSREKSNTAKAPKDSRENHATAIIGIIGAKGDDQGLMGIAPQATIIPIRLIDDYGLTSTAQIVYAFHKADELGAEIINCSWGSSSSDIDNSTMELSDMEKNLYETIATKGNNGKGILIVFASGNKGRSNLNYSPEARYEYNFAVAASDSSDTVTAYSNLGEGIDLIAPGGDTLTPIYTYDRTDQTKICKNGITKVIAIEGYNEGCIAKGFKGTSAAAAMVSATAALVHSINPALSAQEIRDILVTSSDSINCPILSSVNACGAGRLNAARAVQFSLSSN